MGWGGKPKDMRGMILVLKAKAGKKGRIFKGFNSIVPCLSDLSLKLKAFGFQTVLGKPVSSSITSLLQSGSFFLVINRRIGFSENSCQFALLELSRWEMSPK